MTVANAKPDLLMTGPLGTATVNGASSAWSPYTGVEAKLTAAIAYAVSIGAKAVYVPDCFLPYSASLVTFNNAVRMTCEGANPSEFDIRAYGAACDNATNDSAAWSAVISAANAYAGALIDANGFPQPTANGGGVIIRHPGGVSKISSTITIPNNSILSVCGGSTAVLRATGAAFGPMMVLDATAGGAGSRFGVLRDLSFDGAGIATIGLDVGLCVQRHFENIVIRFCTSVGLRVRSAQNCEFLNVNPEENGTTGAFDCQLLLDLGAGNNLFQNCEFSVTAGAVSRGAYNVIFRQSGASPSGAFAVPTLNIFNRCNVERASTTHIAQIYHHAGRLNEFYGCTVASSSTTDAVKADKTDTVATSELLHIIKTYLNGTSQGGNNCLNLAGVAPVIVDNCLIENFSTGIRLDDTSYVHLNEPTTLTVGTAVVPTGAKNISQLVIGGRLFTFAGQPSGTPAFSVVGTNQILYDGTNNMLWSFNGAWRGCALDIGVTSYTANGNTVTVDASQGWAHQIQATGIGAWTLASPSNFFKSKILYVDIWNNSGGVLPVPTLGGAWKTAGALVMPTTGNHRIYVFTGDPFASDWHEVSRSAADVAH